MADHEEGIESVSFLDGLISQETRRRTREQTQPFIDACCTPGCIRSTVLTVGIASLLLTALLITIFLTQSNSSDTPIINPKDPPYWMLNQVTQAQLREHLRFLSSDLMEGRAPGTRGEALAAGYIASHFRTAGLKPINNTFVHAVPMRGLTVLPGAQLQIKASDDVLDLEFGSEFTADSESADSDVSYPISDTQMIFAGYCVFSLRYFSADHDPFDDVGGKIVVCLPGVPLVLQNSTDFGNVSEYYASTNYKLSYMRMLGVKGVLMVHTEQGTGYAWDVFQNRFGAGEQLALQNSLQNSTLSFKGWIPQQVAERIAALDDKTLQDWIDAANSPAFNATVIPATFSLDIHYSVRTFDAQLVLGYLGPPPDFSGDSVLLMAHHDHLGIRAVAPFSLTPTTSSSSSSSSTTTGYSFHDTVGNSTNSNNTEGIYNGAVDNASGLAGLISAAYAISALYKEPFIIHPDYDPPPLVKTVIFMTTTGKENMLGTTYFTKTNFCNYPLCGAHVAFNFDVMNVWGKTFDAVVVGKQMSSLVNEVAEASIAAEKMKSLASSAQPLGDSWPFILNYCPSVTFATASDYDPNPIINYRATKQYRPSDKYSDSLYMEGLQQQVRIALRMAYSLAVNDARPHLTPTFENLLHEIQNVEATFYS